MTLDETYQLLDRISLVDDRIVRADPAEAAGQADMWTAILGDVPLPFAAHAVLEHYKQSPFALRPSDIAERWRKYVHDRLERHTESEPPAGDTGDDTYQAALYAERRAVAIGQMEPRPVTHRPDRVAIEQPASRARALLGTVGEYVPRRRAGVVNVLGVACPRCHALPGHTCTTSGKRRPDAHPARLEDARRIAAGLPPADPAEAARELDRRRTASRAALPPGASAEPADGFQHPAHEEANAS